jgi:glyoxylase-like metal-dependent hydrolase (beta-lactamase superfamily II)
MRTLAALLAAVVLLCPLPAAAQDATATLEKAAQALGVSAVFSLELAGGGTAYAVGQAAAPGQPWPRFTVKDYVRTINYDAAASREVMVRARAEQPPRGGGLPALGEARNNFAVSGDVAWNVVGENALPAPIALAERQFQLWATPHGVIKGAIAHKVTAQGNTIAFAVPGRFRIKATLDDQHLVKTVEGLIPNAVLGDLAVTVTYADYRDFGGVKFPMKITQTASGFPALDLTITGVKVNAAPPITVPDAVKQAANPYTRVQSQMVTEGVWYVTGGSHHSVAIEMRDHVIVVEAPLNDERTLAMLAEVRKLVPGKPVKYLVTSHGHFDHTGGVRAAGGEGIAIVTHEVHRAYFERALAAPATVAPDHLAKSGKRPMVEGVRDKRVMTDGARTVEIHHIAGNQHDDGMLMVYLPKEKLLVQADVFTPPPAGAPVPAVINPNTVQFAEHVARLGLAVDQHLPLHGRIVPFGDLNKAIGR